MKKNVIEKWNNTCIKVLSVEHGKQVINFWKSVGVETNMTGNVIGDYYGLFDGEFNGFTNEKYWCKSKIITLEEAIAIRDKQNKTFPMEMYCWTDNIKTAEIIKIIMKYRIKIYTYQNGRKVFEPQVKKRWSWKTIIYDGSERDYSITQLTREAALICIDKHFTGNTKLQTIEFEYINK